MAEWTKEQILARIDGEADRQQVDRSLARAVAMQESYLNPNAKGDNGNSLGLFQLQPAAAIDVGVNPKFRHEPDVNIYGGVRYLKQKLQQSKGNVEDALRRYNGGGDPNYVQNVMRFFKPGVAEAAERPQGGTYTDADVQQALTALQRPQEPSGGTYTDADVQQALTALRGTQAPTEAPAPPTARSTPEQAAAYRASRGQQEPSTPPAVSQEPPAPPTPPGASQGPPTPDTSWTPGMRFQALPSIQQLPAAERLQRTQEFAGLNPALQEEFLRSEEPTAAGLAMGGGPVRQAPPVTDPAALLAGGRRPPAAPVPRAVQAPAPTTYPAAVQAIEPLTPRGAEAVQDRPHEAGIPLSAVPAMAVNTLGTVGGAALGAPLGPVGSAAGAALGGSLATRANVALGLADQEKPLLETPVANVYPSDLLGAIPLGIAGIGAAAKGTVRNLPGANVARHEIAGERLGELAQRTAPARPASALFTEAAAQGGAVPTTQLWRTAGTVVREEQRMQPGFRNTESIQAGRGLLDLMRQHGGQVPLGELEAYRQRLGQKIGTTTDQAELRRLRQMYAALHGDLEQAATTGTTAGAGTLRTAIATSRREHAHATLTDLWSPGKGLQQTAGDRTQVYGKRIQNQFEKRMTDDQVFAGSWTPAELTDIRATLRDVSRLTRITNPEAQGTVGSTLKWLGRLGGAGYGATTGDLLTGGAMILATEGASAVMARVMQSQVGRLALREAIREGNGTLTHGSLSAIAALVAREAAPESETAPTP
jgi:Transglycosylase SLT domain